VSGTHCGNAEQDERRGRSKNDGRGCGASRRLKTNLSQKIGRVPGRSPPRASNTGLAPVI
jgi:hypothetical protein